MSRNSLLILLVLVVFSLGCSKEEAELRLPEFEVPVVTGYHMRDEAAQPMGAIGLPNVKLGHPSGDWNCDYFISFFPNPAINFGSIHMKSPNANHIKKVWITRAVFRPPYATPVIATDGMNNFIAGGFPLIQAETTDDRLFLNLTELPSGYYRLYVSVNGHLFYDNIVIDKNFIPYY
ncbi:MAG: hypothetical protein EA361_18965 [Bacteroidetes bacterium]|nr:MAG: hypothetical protein EA361_18965 [Bacteroidota bacterium]